MNYYKLYKELGNEEYLSEKLLHFIDIARVSTQSDESSLLLLDNDSEVLRFVATHSTDGAVEKLFGHSVPVSEGVTGLAARTGDVQLGAPTYHDDMFESAVGDVTYVAAAPVEISGTVVGVVTGISYKEDDPYTVTDGQRLATIAHAIALCINEILFDKDESMINPTTKNMILELSESIRIASINDNEMERSTFALIQSLNELLVRASKHRGAY